ncbi:hypothetical protein E3E36_01420 [Thermococcus sp. M36]|uniref:hypothetical protein n=1 Tax=Thermococcus sp. M36 TaxID=1638261 RepID=UPI001439FAD1|nr:hypothetical protein [Thermococcus sp. M36]NJE04830.1 hypothetical protein [Thermococcus sp. M36]
MIGFAIGTGFGVLLAFVYGRFKGRAGELVMAAMAIPLFTYLTDWVLYGNWEVPNGRILVVSTPLGEFTPNGLIGLETFMATLVAVLYLWFRSKESLAIDEMTGASLFIWYLLSMDIGLSASGSFMFFVLGSALLAVLLVLSDRKPLRALKAVPCRGELKELVSKNGLDCLTDGESYAIYKLGNTLVVGGKVIEEFPRWRELVECVLRAPSAGTKDKVLGYGFIFLPAIVGASLGPGALTAAALFSLAFVSMVIWGSYTVRRSKQNTGEKCRGVMEEYAKLFKRKAKEKDKRALVID